jgi:CubicO group peptidase (beta-lactamase class C family)
MPVKTNKIRDAVARHIEIGEISGAATTVITRESIGEVDAQGVSDVDSAFELRPDSVFAMASMTKPVIAASVLALVVSKYTPEFGVPRTVRSLRPGQRYRVELFPGQIADGAEPEFDYAPANREITVHDLLSFTSGLQTIGISNPAIPPITPADSLASWVAKLGEVPLEFQPGTRWHYSNATGYDVLGRVIEVVEGCTLADAIAHRLFEPLDMRHTAFGAQPWMEASLVPLGPLAATAIVRPDYPSGSAGIFSTAGDYARFVSMLLGDGEFDGRRVIPASVVEQMRTNKIRTLSFPGVRAVDYTNPAHADPSVPQRDTPFRYGYGVAIVERPSDDVPLPAGSFGWDGIGTRRFWVVPSLDTAVLIIVPGMGFAADATQREIESLVAAGGR